MTNDACGVMRAGEQGRRWPIGRVSASSACEFSRSPEATSVRLISISLCPLALYIYTHLVLPYCMLFRSLAKPSQRYISSVSTRSLSTFRTSPKQSLVSPTVRNNIPSQSSPTACSTLVPIITSEPDQTLPDIVDSNPISVSLLSLSFYKRRNRHAHG